MSNLIKKLRMTIGQCDCPCQDAVIAKAAKEPERLEAALQRIENWCKAYPRAVFIEPTKEQWAEANRVLDEAGGCSLTAISGSNMRHVVEGIQKIITEALDKEQT